MAKRNQTPRAGESIQEYIPRVEEWEAVTGVRVRHNYGIRSIFHDSIGIVTPVRGLVVTPVLTYAYLESDPENRPAGKYKWNRWSVTHFRSGCGIGPETGKYKAKALVERLGKLGIDWEVMQPAESADPAQWNKVKEIVAHAMREANDPRESHWEPAGPSLRRADPELTRKFANNITGKLFPKT